MLGKLDEKDIEKLQNHLKSLNAGISIVFDEVVCSDPIEEAVQLMDKDTMTRLLHESENRVDFHKRVYAYCEKQIEILGNKRGASIG
jgi:hypothetical protein